MTHTEYLTLIYRLGLKPCAQNTSKYLGLSVRQLKRINQKQSPVPKPVAILLRLYAILTANNKPLKKLNTTPRRHRSSRPAAENYSSAAAEDLPRRPGRPPQVSR